MVITDSHLIMNTFQRQLKIFPGKDFTSIHKIMEFDIIDEVFYHKINSNDQDIKAILNSCEELGVELRLFSDSASELVSNAHKTPIGKITYYTFTQSNKYYYGSSLKTIIDAYFSFITLALLSPAMILIAIAIRLNSSGPVIFKQVRVGLKGRQFYLYKFRTMVNNAETLKKQLLEQNEVDGPVFKIKNDPRITRVGRFLRKTGLDEFPQFFNVLKGEMSLIGPRPPLPDEILQYERWQLRRLSAKPGITCSWQIIPQRNEVKFDKWMRLDIAYIEDWSPQTDTKLLFRTIKTIFGGGGS